MSSADRPNVLLIMTDQQRTDTLSCIGGSPCRTSNIDSIAANGTIFENTITPCPFAFLRALHSSPGFIRTRAA